MKELKRNKIKLMHEIIDLVSDYYEVNLREDTNKPLVSRPRMNAIYLIRKFTNKGLSLEYIAKYFSRGHSLLSIQLRKLTEELPFDKERANEIKELETIIRTTSLYYDRSDKDKLIIQSLNRLQLMNKTQLKHFISESEDYLESIKVEFEEVR